MNSESHSVVTTSKSPEKESKITDYFSTSLTEEDMEALNEEWNGDENFETAAKRPKL